MNRSGVLIILMTVTSLVLLTYLACGPSVPTQLKVNFGSDSIENSWDPNFGVAAPLPTPADTVSGGTAPANAIVFDNIEERGGWGSCNSPSCAGGQGNAAYGMVQQNGVTIFSIGNGVYSNALWWQKLGAYSNTTHFLWDFDFSLDNNSLTAQTLEFDFYQAVNHRKYMFGSQCNYATGTWQGWNEPTTQWVNIPVPCTKFTPNQWHHIQWYFERVPADQSLHYISITIDGRTIPVNVSFPSYPVTWGDVVGCQFQLDTGKSGTGFSEAVNNVKATIW